MLPTLLAALGVTAPLAPFSANEPGGRAILAGMAALLFAAWWGGAGRRRFVVAAALFVCALALRALLLPFALACVVAAWPSVRARAGAAAALVACLALTALASRPPSPPSWAGSPAAETARWVDRDNLFQARAWAARWAATEGGEGDGHLALAKLDWALGHHDEALALAAHVAASGADDGVKQRASQQLRAWAAEGP